MLTLRTITLLERVDWLAVAGYWIMPKHRLPTMPSWGREAPRDSSGEHKSMTRGTLTITAITMLTWASLASASDRSLPCLGGLCLGDPVGEIDRGEIVDQRPPPRERVREDYRKEIENAFPNLDETDRSLLARHWRNRTLTPEVADIVSGEPTMCGFVVLSGRVQRDGGALDVKVAPDTDGQWKVVHIGKRYDVHGRSEKSAYVDEIADAYERWIPSGTGAPASGPNPIMSVVTWDFAGPFDSDGTLQLEHPVIPPSEGEKMHHWGGHFLEHRKIVQGAPYGVINSPSSYNSELYAGKKACESEVSL